MLNWPFAVSLTAANGLMLEWPARDSASHLALFLLLALFLRRRPHCYTKEAEAFYRPFRLCHARLEHPLNQSADTPFR